MGMRQMCLSNRRAFPKGHVLPVHRQRLFAVQPVSRLGLCSGQEVNQMAELQQQQPDRDFRNRSELLSMPVSEGYFRQKKDSNLRRLSQQIYRLNTLTPPRFIMYYSVLQSIFVPQKRAFGKSFTAIYGAFSSPMWLSGA
jgi:hypothetical protein